MSGKLKDEPSAHEPLLPARVSNHLLTVPAVATLLTQLYFVATITLGSRRPPMQPDAGIFEHAGWYLTHGARLYVDIWEPKLPLSYETTAMLSLLAGGDMYWLHLLSVLLMMGMAVGVVLLVTLLARDVTGDPVAAAVAGLSMLLLAGFALRPAYGFKAKYPLLFCGLLSIYLYQHGRPALSGVAAAASVGYWQGGVIFPVLVVGMAIRGRDRRSLVHVVAGGLGTTAVMLLPVVLLWHSTSEMLVQTVLVPLSLDESTPVLHRVFYGALRFKWATPLVLLGAAGLYTVARDVAVDHGASIRRDHWWLPVAAGWFAFLVFFVDFEPGSYTDLIPGLAFVALGLGMLVARYDVPDLRRGVTVAVLAVVVVNVAALGSLGLLFPAVDAPDAAQMSALETNDRADAHPEVGPVPDVRYIYWQQVEPETCHYRLSLMELQWLDYLGPRASSDCVDLSTALAASG